MGPAALLTGWFYVRSVVPYGDIGASSFLLDRFDREPRGSTWSYVFDVRWFESLYTSIATRPLVGYFDSYQRNYGWLVRMALLLAVAGLMVGLVPRARAMLQMLPDKLGSRSRTQLPGTAILMALLATAVVMLAMAQHVAGGGLAHLRYLYPSLAVIAALVVIGLDRLAPRLLPTLLVAAQGVLLFHLVGRTADVLRLHVSAMPEGLDFVPTSDLTRGMAVAVAAVGAVVLAVVLLVRLLEPLLGETAGGEGAVRDERDHGGNHPVGPRGVDQRRGITHGRHAGTSGEQDHDHDMQSPGRGVRLTKASTGADGRVGAQRGHHEHGETEEAGSHEHG